MEIIKIRDLGDQELKQEELKAAEQIFRLRFQLKLGQTEGVKKLRSLKRDIARFKTIEQERALGIRGAAAVAGNAPAVESKGRKAKKGTR
jgi:large subunit ribosomal protein L29